MNVSGSTPRKPAVAALLSLIIAGLLWAAPFARAQPVGFAPVTSYSSAEIGEEAASFGMAQDASGILYVGGHSLFRFDGERWKSTAIAGSYAIRALDFSRDGRLWVGAVNEIGWCDRQPDGALAYHSLISKLPAGTTPLGEVWKVFADDAGATFVSTDRVLRWNGSEFTISPLRPVRRLSAMRAGNTVYVHAADGLLAFDGANPRLVIPQHVLGNAIVVDLEQRGDAWLLFTSEGLFRFANGRTVPFADVVSEALRRHRITNGPARLQDGRYAFPTLTGGIVLMNADGSPAGTLAEREGVSNAYITSLFVDRDGALWATSMSRVFRVDLHGATTVFDRRANLPAQSYIAIAAHAGRIVVASDGGAYEQSGAGNFSRLPVQGMVHDVRATPRGVVVGGFKAARLLGSDGADSIYETQHDVLTVAASRTTPDALLLSDGDAIVLLDGHGGSRTAVSDLPALATSIVDEGADTLWVATFAEGVFVAHLDPQKPARAVPVPAHYGLPALAGRSYVRGTLDGGLVVFADNGGWLKPAGETRFRPIAHHPVRPIRGATDVSADGTIWTVYPAVGTQPACVGKISVRGDAATWEPHALPALGSIGVPLCIFAESGRNTVLWIGGTQSVLRHEVVGTAAPLRPRPPILHAFARSAAEDVAHPIAAALPYATRSIEFEFAAPEFSRRAQLRLETMIEGIDHDWMPAGVESRRSLTALRDGDYIFRVRAVAETGAASEPTVFRFTVRPPWWRTAPATFGFALALAAAGVGVYRLRLRTLRRRNAELEEKVRERTEELEAANAAKTQFVANMSHDIRNPLNGIVGLALALEDTPLDDRQQEIVSTLRECTTYLSSLVDDVLDFASIEAGRVELRPGPFAPPELLRSIVETLKADTAERGATLLVDTNVDLPPTLVGDAGRIQQILVNFVSNALKYAGGTIRLHVSVPAGSPGEVEFSVEDQGSGISEADQAVLFTKFTRLEQRRGEDIPGSGLGLAACRLLADLMGGSVGVQSRLGHGSRFFLRLPLTVATAPVEAPAAALPNTTVLLVEDADYNAWAASAVLAKLGLACERARTGAEALALFGQKRFPIVLLDRNLPDMDGTEVARQMRAMETDEFRAVLLAVTAYCTAEDRQLCLDAGMDAFVGKPLTPDKLRKVLVSAGKRLLAAASVHVPEKPAAKTEVDYSLLSYLSDGSEEGLDAQVERFVGTIDEAMTHLEAALGERNFERLAALGHQLKGQAKMVGAATLTELSALLEAAARAGDLSRVRAQLSRTAEEVQLLTAAMRRRRPAVPSA